MKTSFIKNPTEIQRANTGLSKMVGLPSTSDKFTRIAPERTTSMTCLPEPGRAVPKGEKAMHHATRRVYYNNTYQFSLPAMLLSTGRDNRGPFALFNQTIFHPQGGGQPADFGVVQIEGQNITVQHVALVEGEIRHYGDFLPVGAPCSVTLTIDQEKRCQFAALHSGGHLIAHVMEQAYPGLQACKGHHFPDGPHVEFNVEPTSPPQIFSIDHVNEQILAVVKNKQTIAIHLATEEQPNRMIQFGDCHPVPCGGTHVDTTDQLLGLFVTKIKNNKGKIKVSYIIKN